MTREEAIKLMREAGFVVSVSVEHWGDVPFAKLCHPTPTSASLYRMLESLINRAVTHEREACAQIASHILKMPQNDISTLIRARGMRHE